MKTQLCSCSSICTAQCISQALPCLGLFHCSQISRWQSLGQEFPTLHLKDKQYLQEPTHMLGVMGSGLGEGAEPPGSPEMHQGGIPSSAEPWCCQELLKGPEQRKPFAGYEKKKFYWFGRTYLQRPDLLTICTDHGNSGERYYLHFLLVASLTCQPWLCLVRAEPSNVSCKSFVINREHIKQEKIYFFLVLELFVCFNPYLLVETSIYAWIPTCFLVGLRIYCFWMSQTLLLLLLLLPFLFPILNLNYYLFGLLDIPHPLQAVEMRFVSLFPSYSPYTENVGKSILQRQRTKWK